MNMFRLSLGFNSIDGFSKYDLQLSNKLGKFFRLKFGTIEDQWKIKEIYV